jgi:hypothetical protein
MSVRESSFFGGKVVMSRKLISIVSGIFAVFLFCSFGRLDAKVYFKADEKYIPKAVKNKEGKYDKMLITVITSELADETLPNADTIKWEKKRTYDITGNMVFYRENGKFFLNFKIPNATALDNNFERLPNKTFSVQIPDEKTFRILFSMKNSKTKAKSPAAQIPVTDGKNVRSSIKIDKIPPASKTMQFLKSLEIFKKGVQFRW